MAHTPNLIRGPDGFKRTEMTFSSVFEQVCDVWMCRRPICNNDVVCFQIYEYVLVKNEEFHLTKVFFEQCMFLHGSEEEIISCYKL